jgi:hypothetical protein
MSSLGITGQGSGPSFGPHPRHWGSKSSPFSTHHLKTVEFPVAGVGRWKACIPVRAPDAGLDAHMYALMIPAPVLRLGSTYAGSQAPGLSAVTSPSIRTIDTAGAWYSLGVPS